MTKHVPATYANAYVRGQMRLFKQKLAEQYDVFDRAVEDGPDNPLQDVVIDFARKKGKGRERAYDRLKRAFGPGAMLEQMPRTDGRYPLALWSIFKPRESITVSAPKESGLLQDCVAIDYILVGRIHDHAGVYAGLWTLEVPDHALGRAIERSGGKPPDAIMREAHKTLIQLPHDAIELDQAFRVKAGAGCFVCELNIRRDVSIEDMYGVHVHTHTWLSNDMLHDDQKVLSAQGKVGDRLVDNWLRPHPLCHIERIADGFQCSQKSWKRSNAK